MKANKPNFGNLNKMLSKAKKIIEPNIEDNMLSLSQVHNLKQTVYNELIKDYSEINYGIIDNIFNKLFNTNYVFNKKVNFENGKNSFRGLETYYPEIEVPPEYIKLEEQFNKLKLLPQPVQRSKEWFDYRYNRITASDTAAAIDMNPYEPVEGFILKKCDPNFPFRDNATVFHGKKYEPIATMIYEHIYNTRVYEFGALPSEKYNFLGASPDGICSKYTLDNKFSTRLGTMLEIKCPVTRDIHTSGTIAGDICPFYYFCQVQQQLACCELQVCDFWQCKLLEYSREEYLADACNGITTEGIVDPSFPTVSNPTNITIDRCLKKGIIIEFFPKNFIPEFDGDNIEWKSKYIIPYQLDMNEEQYDIWVLNIMNNYKTLYPEIAEKYYFNKIIYWNLQNSHNISIKYDDVFMTNLIPVLQDTWSKVSYYRKNLDKLDSLKTIVEERKKYIKINTNYKISNNNIIDNKILFLGSTPIINTNEVIKTKTTVTDSNKSKPKVTSVPSKYYESDLEDFDSGTATFIDDDIPKEKPKVTKKIKHTELSVPKKEVSKKTKKEIISNDDCNFID